LNGWVGDTVLHSVEWDGKNQDGSAVSSGVYFYQLRAGTLSATRKLVVLK
jgi:flagellar hook assembly protein FlgD